MKIYALETEEVNESLRLMSSLVDKSIFQVEALHDIRDFCVSDAARLLARFWYSSGDYALVYSATFKTLLCLRGIANRDTSQHPGAVRAQSLEEYRKDNQTILEACKHLKDAAELAGLPADYFLEYPQPIWVHPSEEELFEYCDISGGRKIREELAFANFCEANLVNAVAAVPKRRGGVGADRQAVRDLVLATGITMEEFKDKRLFKSYVKTLRSVLEFANIFVSEDTIRSATREAYNLADQMQEIHSINVKSLSYLISPKKK